MLQNFTPAGTMVRMSDEIADYTGELVTPYFSGQRGDVRVLILNSTWSEPQVHVDRIFPFSPDQISEY